MRINKLSLSLILAGMLAGTSAFAGVPVSDQTAMFISKSAASSAFEIESSKMALGKSRNPQIRDFAQKMIADHSKAANEMKSILMAEHLPPAPHGFDDKQIAMLNKLHGERGSKFDAQYIAEQEKAHVQAVNLFSMYADHGDNRDLKKFAAQTTPVLEQHKRMIDMIANR